MKVTILCLKSLRAGNAVSKHKWGYKLQNVPAVVVPISDLYLHTQWNESHLPAAKA